MPKKEGSPIVFAMSTNPISREIANSLELAARVQASLHSTASKQQRDKIKKIVKALTDLTEIVALDCPQPFYENYVVDKDKFTLVSQRPAAKRTARKRAR